MTGKKHKPAEIKDEQLDRAAGGFDEADALFGKRHQTAQNSRGGVGILKSTDEGGTWR